MTKPSAQLPVFTPEWYLARCKEAPCGTDTRDHGDVPEAIRLKCDRNDCIFGEKNNLSKAP